MTHEITTIWNEWLKKGDVLLHILYEQSAALVLRDTERLQRLQPDLEHLLKELEQLDTRAVEVRKKLADAFGAEPNLRSILLHLEKVEGQKLLALANKVNMMAQDVRNLLDKNKLLVENEVQYIHGTIAILAKAAQEQEDPYQTGVGTGGPAIIDRVA